MLKLYEFDPVWGIPNPNLFCMRMETYLRMTDQPFEVQTGVQYLSKAPKKKRPYIEDNGVVGCLAINGLADLGAIALGQKTISR